MQQKVDYCYGNLPSGVVISHHLKISVGTLYAADVWNYLGNSTLNSSKLCTTDDNFETYLIDHHYKGESLKTIKML